MRTIWHRRFQDILSGSHLYVLRNHPFHSIPLSLSSLFSVRLFTD